MGELHFNKALLLPVFCILFLFSSCGKTPVHPGVSLQEILTEYDSPENVNAFTVAADGTFFLVSHDRNVHVHWLYQYNTDGERTGQFSLEPYALVRAITANEDGSTVYFSGQHSSNGIALLALDMETGEFSVLYEFPYFVQIKKLVLLGGRIYVLGQQRWSNASGAAGSDYDFSAGEMLMYYSFDTGEAYRLGFEYPINIAAMETGNLMVLGHLPGTGYCLMEYDPQVDDMQVRQTLEVFKFDDFAVCNSGDSVLYGYPGNQHGLVMSDLDNLALEVEVYEYAVQYNTSSCVAYAGGKVYCRDNLTKNFVEFPLEYVQRQNKEIHLISADLPFSPYSCGYALDRIEMSWEQIALKVLAQDRNFDLCMGASDYDSSQILRGSNTFYPLNDVPGVEEYLDRCFPYVREAAMQDGMVWMFPFTVWTTVMLVQEDVLAQEGIALRDGMTLAEFVDLMQGLSRKQRRRILFAPYGVGRTFIRQYINYHAALEDSETLKILQGLSFLQQEIRLAINEALPCKEGSFGLYAELDAYVLNQYEELGAVVYSDPKGSRDGKNAMQCFFLAVNPNSDRLQETLSYIADLAGYLSHRDDLLYFEEYNAGPGSLADQLHEQFRNGEISFTIDSDVFEPGFADMLYGRISAEEYLEETNRKLMFYFGE